MDDARQANEPVDWRRRFSWLLLFRAFRIAVDPRKMLLAGVGLLILSLGEWGISELPFAPALETSPVSRWPWEEPYGWEAGAGISQQLAADPARTLWAIATNWKVVLRPVAPFVEPVRLLFDPQLTWSTAAYAAVRLVWTLLVWSLFAGAITRMAALQFARDEQIGLRQAVRFAAGRLLSFFAAPLLPLAGVALLWLPCFLGGLVGRIPGVGEPLVGALYLLPLVMGALMALVLAGAAAGWPLMFATISAEGSDAFDGLTRSYSYVFDRPWHYLWYAVVALVYGSVVVFFITLMFSLTVYLAGWSVASGMGHDRVAGLYRLAPDELGGTSPWEQPAPRDEGVRLGGRMAGVWLQFAALLKAGFVYSYFWTAATIIYFLLRKSDDATDFSEVYLPDQPEEDELLPLVGVAASEQPVVERPPPEARE
jgi:hypothetical protein